MSETLSRRVSRAMGAGAMALAAYYGLLGGEYDVSDMRRLEAERAVLNQRLDSLRGELTVATAWADSLENDERVIERVARQRYSFIRPGEILYRFVDDEPAEADETGDPEDTDGG